VTASGDDDDRPMMHREHVRVTSHYDVPMATGYLRHGQLGLTLMERDDVSLH